MEDNKMLKKSIWPRYVISAFVILLTFLLFLGLGLFDGLVRAQNGPEIEVESSFSGKPLLGGTATLSVDRKNIATQ